MLFIGDGDCRGASLQRVRTLRNENILVANHWLRTADGKTHHQTKGFPAKAKAGSLRITRKGDRITFWAADAGSDDFRALASAEFTADPVRLVRIYGQPGRAPNAVTVRFSDLVLRAESLLVPHQRSLVFRSNHSAGWAELWFDFRKKQWDAEQMERFGWRDCLVHEDQGLKVAIPTGKTSSNTGIAPRKQIVGDFEISANFELLEVPKPETGDGAGAVLFIGDGDRRGASLQRVRTPRDENIFVTNHWLRAADGKTHHQTKGFPTEAKSGSLLITRKGATITFWAADAGSEDFHELESAEFTAEPIRLVRIYGQPGRAPNAVTVRFSDLVLRAESLLAPNQRPSLH